MGGIMGFKLGKRSLKNLEGVNPNMAAVVGRAIQITNIDFGVTQGLRTEEEQELLVATGASKTMKSKHLTGNAVDVVAYLGSRVSWEITLYDDIADAMKIAAKELGVSIRWGAAWQINNIVEYSGTMQDATNDYVDLRRSQGRRPFIDAPHFEET
jgi:peptidoglycan L-alanyl-D-glutamate endopeptidase CwlK